MVAAARFCAQQLGRPQVGPEHLLLALSSSETPVGEVLRGEGATIELLVPVLARLVAEGANDGEGPGTIHGRLGVVANDRRAARAAGPNVAGANGRGVRAQRADRLFATGQIVFSEPARRALKRAGRRARSRQRTYVRIDDLALALLASPDSVPARMLRELNISRLTIGHGIGARYQQRTRCRGWPLNFDGRMRARATLVRR